MGFHTKEAKRQTLRGVDRDLRRARLLAARRYAPGSVPRRGIMSGHWDGGVVVRQFLAEEVPSAAHPLARGRRK